MGVGLDMCDVVGHVDETGPKHERRWFRNVYTEPIGSMEACDVAGGEIAKPFVPPGQECIRPIEPPVSTDTSTSEDKDESSEEVKDESSEEVKDESSEEVKDDPSEDAPKDLTSTAASAFKMGGLVFAMLAVAYTGSL